MAMKITATYADGVFTPEAPVALPEGASIWMALEDRFAPALPEGSPLAAAERAFAAAFANGGWDEARAREGCVLAWNVARQAMASAAEARGWPYKSDIDLLRAAKALDGLDANGKFLDKPRCYYRYRAAEIFRDRAIMEDGQDMSPLLAEVRQFEDGLWAIHNLVNEIAEIAPRMERMA